MGEIVAVSSFTVQLIPLVISGCKKFRGVCSRSKRREMRDDYSDLEDLYASIEVLVQNLERNVRKQFKRRTRQACNALKWLAVLSQRPYPGQSRRSRWKLRVRQAVVYLLGQDTLRCALEQMDHVWDALKRHDDANRILGALELFEEKCRHWVERFRRAEHLVRNRARFPMATAFSHTRRQSASSNTETMYSQSMTYHQSGFDGLPDSSAAQRRERQMDRLRNNGNSRWRNNQEGGSNRPQMGEATNLRWCVPPDDLTTPGKPSETADGNTGPTQNDLSGRTNVGSIYGEQSGEVGSEGQDLEPSLIDNGGDEVLNSTTVDAFPVTATTTALGFDADTLFIGAATPSDNPGTTSLAPNESDSEPTSGPDLEDDERQSNTGSDGTISEPDSSVCEHKDVSIHSWNWSLIVYASSGLRIKCRTCGEQRSKTEFSSLLEKSEDGAANLNWDHISNLRWWPGGAWTWG